MRRLMVIALPVALLAGAAACDSPQRVRQRANETLPPLPPTVAARRTTTTTVAPVEVTYVVKQGDTLSLISARVHVEESVLVAINGLSNPDHLTVGQVLIVSVPTTTAPGTTLSPTSTIPGAPAST